MNVKPYFLTPFAKGQAPSIYQGWKTLPAKFEMNRRKVLSSDGIIELYRAWKEGSLNLNPVQDKKILLEVQIGHENKEYFYQYPLDLEGLFSSQWRQDNLSSPFGFFRWAVEMDTALRLNMVSGYEDARLGINLSKFHKDIKGIEDNFCGYKRLDLSIQTTLEINTLLMHLERAGLLGTLSGNENQMRFARAQGCESLKVFISVFLILQDEAGKKWADKLQYRLIEFSVLQVEQLLDELKNNWAKYIGNINQKELAKTIGISNLGSLYKALSAFKNEEGKRWKDVLQYDCVPHPAAEIDLQFMEDLDRKRRVAFLPIEDQLKIIKKEYHYPWENIPNETRKCLVELLAKKAEVSVDALNINHYKRIIIDEIGFSLGGLYNNYYENSQRNGLPVCQFILEELGFKKELAVISLEAPSGSEIEKKPYFLAPFAKGKIPFAYQRWRRLAANFEIPKDEILLHKRTVELYLAWKEGRFKLNPGRSTKILLEEDIEWEGEIFSYRYPLDLESFFSPQWRQDNLSSRFGFFRWVVEMDTALRLGLVRGYEGLRLGASVLVLLHPKIKEIEGENCGYKQLKLSTSILLKINTLLNHFQRADLIKNIIGDENQLKLAKILKVHNLESFYNALLVLENEEGQAWANLLEYNPLKLPVPQAEKLCKELKGNWEKYVGNCNQKALAEAIGGCCFIHLYSALLHFKNEEGVPWKDVLKYDCLKGSLSEADPRLLEDLDRKRNLSSLLIKEQLEIMQKKVQIYWRDYPIETHRYLVEILAEKAGISVYDLGQEHYIKIKIDETGSSLSGFYGFYLDHIGRKKQNTPEFILDQLGFGERTINPLGTLWASTRAELPSRSLSHILSAARKAIKLWKKHNPDQPVTKLSFPEIQEFVVGNAEFEGLRKALQGFNVFDLSTIEIICRALQHVPLDELGLEIKPNYLRSELFPSYRSLQIISRVKTHGYFSLHKQRYHELGDLVRVIEAKINRLIQNQAENFEIKWLETQGRILSEIMESIQRRGALNAPLTYALGLYTSNTGSIPPPKLIPEGQLLNMEELNPAQKAAARLILEDSNPLAMIHGPAGSGKTSLLLPVVEQLIRQGRRVLYVTSTHKATDVFMERIHESEEFKNLPVLRLGSRVAAEGNERSVPKMSETAREYWAQDWDAINRFKKNRENIRGMLLLGTMGSGVHFLGEAEKRTREKIFTEQMEGKSPIKIFRDIFDYDVVIIDEASMASKSEVYATLSQAGRGVIIGDHVQLAPFSIEDEIKDSLGLNEKQKESVERSLLEQLMIDSYPHILLDVNYRAINPIMIVLASRIFYDEKIKVNQNSPYFTLTKEGRQKVYPKDSLKIIDTSLLPYAKKEERVEPGRYGTDSFYNRKEIELAVEQTKYLLWQESLEGEKLFKLKDIAFVTPYTAQVERLKERLREAFPNEATEEYLERWVSTFDGFQGDENKCVIVSFVRSNNQEPPETGFVGNHRRVNVGITRAKERMILIGDWETLKITGRDDKFKDLNLKDKNDQKTRHIFEELVKHVSELGRIKKLNP